jgi:hypothetical protein
MSPYFRYLVKRWRNGKDMKFGDYSGSVFLVQEKGNTDEHVSLIVFSCKQRKSEERKCSEK